MIHTLEMNPAKKAFALTVCVVFVCVSLFFALEPTIGRSQQTDSFLVSQTITNEISFLVTAPNVTMAGSIAGITGGYATGTTVASINTNNVTGYNMTLHFATNSVPHAMYASSSGAYINNYTPASTSPGVPDFTWVDNSTGQAAEFGYTVRASTTSEVDLSFMNDGSACNAGTNETNDRCWLNPTTTPERIINSSAANTSSTTTIKFKVAVPNSPSPALISGIYVATGTLTATTNP